MEARKLTPEEIDGLYDYCWCNSVQFYEIQAELVDHLATGIEELWENKPSLPFDEAMYQVGDKFGGSLGFAAIKEEKEKAIRKKYWRLLWQFAVDFYKFPKMVITLLLALGLYYAFRFAENDQWIMVPLAVLLIGLSIFYRRYYFPKYVKIQATAEYPFLLNEIALNGILSPRARLFLVIFITNLVLHPRNFSTSLSVIFSILISLYLILLYGEYFYISKRIREHFTEQFPQFIRA